MIIPPFDGVRLIEFQDRIELVRGVRRCWCIKQSKPRRGKFNGFY